MNNELIMINYPTIGEGNRKKGQKAQFFLNNLKIIAILAPD